MCISISKETKAVHSCNEAIIFDICLFSDWERFKRQMIKNEETHDFIIQLSTFLSYP